MTDTKFVDDGERLAPVEALTALGNETRLEILYELWDAGEGPVQFTDLRKRVGVRDGSQFNYHLEKLTGPFIRKTDDGYVIRNAGVEVIWAVMMGTYDEPLYLDPFEIPGTCVVCAASLQARYDDGMMFVECSVCGQFHEFAPFPTAGLVGRTNEETVAAFHDWMRPTYNRVVNGVCWGCGGTTTPVVTRQREDTPTRMNDEFGTPAYEMGVKYECEHCTRYASISVGTALLFDPDVIEFYRDHGIDLTATPYWELDWYVSDEHTTVLSEDPWRFRLTIPLNDEELRATLDGNLDVTAVERAGRIPVMAETV